MRFLTFCSLDDNGNPIPNEGYEFTLHVRGSVPDDSSIKLVENDVMVATKEVVQAILLGKLD